MAVDDAGRRDQPVAVIGCVCGPMVQVDAVADVRVAGPTDPDDPAVLDADVRLDDAEGRVDDDRARITTSSSEGPALPPWAIRARKFFA